MLFICPGGLHNTISWSSVSAHHFCKGCCTGAALDPPMIWHPKRHSDWAEHILHVESTPRTVWDIGYQIYLDQGLPSANRWSGGVAMICSLIHKDECNYNKWLNPLTSFWLVWIMCWYWAGAAATGAGWSLKNVLVLFFLFCFFDIWQSSNEILNLPLFYFEFVERIMVHKGQRA